MEWHQDSRNLASILLLHNVELICRYTFTRFEFADLMADIGKSIPESFARLALLYPILNF